ncbi:MAG: nuclear transport factor 2 family protein [Thermoanaerobaculia bacterium]
MRTASVVLAALLASGLAQRAPAQENPRDLAREAIASERAYWEAETKGNIALIEAFLPDDFIQVSTGPKNDFSVIRGKKEALEDLRKLVTGGKLVKWRVDEPTAQVMDKTVVLTYTWTETYLPNAKAGVKPEPASTRGIATSVWVRRPEGWKNLNFHWHSRPDPER